MSRTVQQHFAVREPYSEYSWALGDGMLRLTVHARRVHIPARHGICAVDGRAYTRTWLKYFGERTIMTNESNDELYASIVSGLRSRGWRKADAESEALDRVERACEPEPLKDQGP